MLKNKAINGLLWSAVDSFSSQFVAFIIGIVLARLLTPEDFGLIGMITVFIAVSQIFINSGIKDALIRRKNVDLIYYNTAFIYNTVVSILLYIIIFFSAEYIASFYEEPQLVNILRVIAITLIFNAFRLVQQVQIAKKIDFRALTKVTLFSSVTSGFVGIILAYLGYGVWSLVWREILLSFLSFLALSTITKWWPTFSFSKTAFKDLFGFGSRLMILGVIDTIYNNIYLLIIGKYFSAAQLGQFTRAETFKRLPTEGLTQIFQRVSYPILAELQDNKEKLKSGYRRLIKSLMLISITGMFILAAVAPDLIVVLLGEQWEPAGTYLQILCFSGFFYPLISLNSNMLKVMNRSDLILKIGVWTKVLAIPVILVLIFIGIIPFLYALVIHQFLNYLLISNYSKSFINYGTMDQVKDFLSIFITMILIFAGLLFLSLTWDVSPLVRLITLTIGGFAFSLIVYNFLRFEAFLYAKNILMNKLRSS